MGEVLSMLAFNLFTEVRMSIREKLNPRFPLLDIIMARLALVTGVLVMGSMLLMILGYYDPQFADRTMKAAMAVSSAFWLILVWEVWSERAPSSRDIMYLTLLMGSAATSIAGNFIDPLYGGAVVLNFLMWVSIFLGQFQNQKQESQVNHE